MRTIIVVLAVGLLATCSPVAPPTGRNHVDMTSSSTFSPESLAVSVGDTVVWVNQAAVPHTSTSGVDGVPDSLWNSGTLNQGDSFSFVFANPGNYHYYCAFHFSFGMKGVVTVR
jgi:plastocyanin